MEAAPLRTPGLMQLAEAKQSWSGTGQANALEPQLRCKKDPLPNPNSMETLRAAERCLPGTDQVCTDNILQCYQGPQDSLFD